MLLGTDTIELLQDSENLTESLKSYNSDTDSLNRLKNSANGLGSMVDEYLTARRLDIPENSSDYEIL